MKMCIEGAESSDDFILCFPYFQEIHEFRGNSVYILFISSKWLGVFELNFGTFSEGSIEIFLNPYLRMSIWQLFINTEYLQISRYGIS